MARLVQNHSTNILGLIKWLNRISRNPQIKTITPGCLSHANGIEEKLSLKISRRTRTGFKLIARKGKSVQEVYMVTTLEEKCISALIAKTNPYVSLKKKHF